MRALTVSCCVLLWGSVSRASPAAAVDWSAGLVTAEGVGLADRHAPNPAVARGTSRRDAEAAAKKLLATRVAALPLASGGTVGDKLKDKAVAARVDRAIDAALTVTADPETDGAWNVTLGVPIEAVRQAIAGPRALAAGAQDSGAPVVIVDGVTAAKPAVGWTIGGIAAPVVWVTAPPAWAKDAPHVKATSAKKGAIEIGPGITATAATLFVIVTGS